MFQPAIFSEDRPDVMHELMQAHPFATLVSIVEGTVTADHVPLVPKLGDSAHGRLQGHIAAGNPLFRCADGPQDALSIFQGPQSYVTPSWYASKAEHGKVVPTWNYVVVHARGPLRFVRDPEWLMRHLNDLTDEHESRRDTPWKVSDAPSDFVARQLRGLVGFEIEIAELTGAWKVSQNKSAADREGVRQGMMTDGSAERVRMGRLVEERATAQRRGSVSS